MENTYKLSESQILSEESMEAIESGACKSSCKKACATGNMNGSTGGTFQVPADVIEKVKALK